MGPSDTHVFTDHRNFLLVFHPNDIEPGLGSHIVLNLQIWTLFLSQFADHIDLVSGEKNMMADMMTRWYVGFRGKRQIGMAHRVKNANRETKESYSLLAE